MPVAHECTPAEDEALLKGICPDCRSSLLRGQRGGDALMVKCSDPTCGSEFNICAVTFKGKPTLPSNRLT